MDAGGRFKEVEADSHDEISGEYLDANPFEEDVDGCCFFLIKCIGSPRTCC